MFRDESENEEADIGHSETGDDYRTDDQSEEEAEEHNVFLKENGTLLLFNHSIFSGVQVLDQMLLK